MINLYKLFAKTKARDNYLSVAYMLNHTDLFSKRRKVRDPNGQAGEPVSSNRILESDKAWVEVGMNHCRLFNCD